jgi:hypothetical protein
MFPFLKMSMEPFDLGLMADDLFKWLGAVWTGIYVSPLITIGFTVLFFIGTKCSPFIFITAFTYGFLAGTFTAVLKTALLTFGITFNGI